MFMVFAGYHHYPSGGMEDYRRSFSTLDEAKAFATDLLDWSHVVDMNDGMVHEYLGDGRWLTTPFKQWEKA